MTIEDIAIQFVATLFGVLIGIPIAFWLERIITASHEKEKAEAVLTALKAELSQTVISYLTVMRFLVVGFFFGSVNSRIPSLRFACTASVLTSAGNGILL